MSIGNIAAYLTQTGMVLRTTVSQATTGAIINTWTSQSEVMGRLRPFVAYRWGTEILNADKVTDQSNYRWYCATTADITPADRLRVDGDTYRVVFVSNVMSMDRLMQVDLKLVSHDA